MNRKLFSTLVVVFLVTTLLGGQGIVSAKPRAALALPLGSDEFFQLIGNELSTALEAEGYRIQISDADGDPQTMVKQIQNFTISQVDFLYVFPAGDADAFHDVMVEATNYGIQTLVSHNNTGPNSAIATVQADEFIMGTMMAPLVSQWIDQRFPNAEPGEIKVLALEQSMIPDMVKRSTGMKIIGEKFLRKVDMSSGKYIANNGDPVQYVDDAGAMHDVNEPTGGLILDENGYAMLNPFYDERVTVLTTSNRMIQTNMDAQNALDAFIPTRHGRDIKVVMSYGGDGAAGASEKIMSFVEQGIIQEDLSNLAVFGADITESNINRILESRTNKSLVRGVMTNGDIIQTIVDTAVKMVRGEDVPAEFWEDLGYMYLSETGDEVVQVLYNDELPATELFFAD